MNSKQARIATVHSLVASVFDDDLHAKRVFSLAQATVGAMHSASLGIHAIGAGLAAAKSLNAKHAIKQVDRLFSNEGVDPWQLFGAWVPFAVGQRREIVVVMDWTDFDKDNQSTIALHLVTRHGRATPLIWQTVIKSELAGWRNAHEDRILQRLKETLPAGVKVTLLADRGFGDQKLYAFLQALRFDFVIRFRECILVEDENGESRPAAEWVPSNGRTKVIRNALVTADRSPVPAVVCMKAKGMQDSWCLATSLDDASGSVVVALYGRRFTIEENFRDTKNLRFGMGLSSTRIGNPARRDRILLVGALAVALLTLLGAAGEKLGWDRMMKANTVKRRTHSLFRQGCFYYDCILTMTEERLRSLMQEFAALLVEHRVFSEVLGSL